MENSIYESMTAASQLLEKQNIISNNLANISTTGFKEKFIFSVKNEKMDDINHNIIKEYYNLSTGQLNYTNRNLDVFIQNGWLVVKDIHGKEGYTKNGHLKINANRQLIIQNNKVVGNHGTIIIPNNLIVKILSNGAIKTIHKNNNHDIENTIDKLKLVHLPINDLIQKENGLFYLKKNSKKNQHNNAINDKNKIRVQSGFLEESNVNSAKNIVEMISNARQFDMQMKMISACDQNAEYANQLLNINN